jgi:acyl-CoA reductase-like NAD-dependent aldehyde dehydrogenase
VVRSFKTEEVMTMSNNINFGLMAGVFAQYINQALRVASEFESRMVDVFHGAIWWKQGERSGERTRYQRIESVH